MALNNSGPISLAGSTSGQSIALELGLGATTQISLNDAAVRGLAGKASGAIVMPTDFYGKSGPFTLTYLISGGGGGGGYGIFGQTYRGGGGGSQVLNTTVSITPGTSYSVSIGGAGANNGDNVGGNGTASNFSSFSATGGYGVGNFGEPRATGGRSGSGNPGGARNGPDGGGGGGATGNGQAGPGDHGGGTGGAGLTSSISGSSLGYGGGGGGGNNGSGVDGGANAQGGSAPANRGGGGGANPAAGTGVVILRYPNTFTISNPGGGLGLSTTTSGSDKITTITSGSGNVSWS